jgi:hypothetical protein
MKTDEEIAHDIAICSHGDHIRQYGDTTKCERCGLVWDINDPLPPLCQVPDGPNGPDWSMAFRDPYEDPAAPYIWPTIAAVMTVIALIVMYA